MVGLAGFFAKDDTGMVLERLPNGMATVASMSTASESEKRLSSAPGLSVYSNRNRRLPMVMTSPSCMVYSFSTGSSFTYRGLLVVRALRTTFLLPLMVSMACLRDTSGMRTRRVQSFSLSQQRHAYSTQ